MNFPGLALLPCEGTRGGGDPAPQASARLGHPARGQEASWYLRASLLREGSFAETQKLPSPPPPDFSWGGCKTQPPFPVAPGWGRAPTCPMRSGAALRPGAGWAPGDPSPRPMQAFNATQEPVREAAYPPGHGEIPAWHSPPASLHACGSQAETTQLI